jgi:hypothetical protein
MRGKYLSSPVCLQICFAASVGLLVSRPSFSCLCERDSKSQRAPSSSCAVGRATSAYLIL